MNLKKKQFTGSTIRLLLMGLLIVIIFTNGLFFAYSSFHTKKQTDFASFTNQLFADSLSSDGLGTHFLLTRPEEYGVDLSNVSLGHVKDDEHVIHTQNENLLAACRQFSSESLSLDERVTLDLMMQMIQNEDRLCSFSYYAEPLDSIHGIHVELPILLAEYRLQTKADITSYFQLISDVPRLFDELCDYEEIKSAKGLFMPPALFQEVEKELICFSKPDGFTFLSESFERRIDSNFPQYDKEQKQALLDRQQAAIQNELLPAYTSLLTAMTRLKASSVYEGGLCHLKNGRAYYAALVRSSTGSDRDLSEIIDLISDYRQESIDKLALLSKKDMNLMSEITQYKLPVSGEEQVLSYLQREIQSDFPAPGETDFTVRQVADDMQDFLSPAFYLSVPMDDPATPVIYINPGKQVSDLNLFTTLAHEGFPGHLYETSQSYGNHFLPIRSLFEPAGYTEGFATYAELFSYRYSGLSETAAEFARQQDIFNLTLYASIDLGVHAEGWDETIVHEFLCDYGITDESIARSIYELVLQSPGNYLKYVLGAFEFEELKKEARAKYEDTYSDLAFHQTLLRIGPAPFSIIRNYFDAYYSCDKSS